MTGGRLLPVASTVIEKGGSELLSLPSLTLMTMFDVVPSLEMPGAAVSRPVFVLNAAHAGRFLIEKVSLLPSGSLATGMKLYVSRATTEVAGMPEMVGARLLWAWEG